MTALRVEKLARHHAVDAFDCGKEPLNRFLIRYALPNQQANASQTYVGIVDAEIAGYYSLAVGEVRHDQAAERLAKGLARHPVPIMLLARLAVSQDWQGRAVGKALLRDAILRTLNAADIAGIRALVVHAKDDKARSFYERFGFTPSPSDPLHLFVLISDLRRL